MLKKTIITYLLYFNNLSNATARNLHNKKNVSQGTITYYVQSVPQTLAQHIQLREIESELNAPSSANSCAN